MQTYQFNVQGMSCGGCVGKAQRTLGALEGVAQVDVQLRPGSATVQVDPDHVTPELIQSALGALGFTAQLVPAGI